MKLSDVQRRLTAPFPSHMVMWKPGRFADNNTRALMFAHIDARAVMDRLDAICPDDWHFAADPVVGPHLATVRGSLTVLGVRRDDIGEAKTGDLGTFKAAASDALKRCAIQFGIGRYLYDLPRQWVDWDVARGRPAEAVELPEWALPEPERSPGGRHIAQALEQLKYELPDELDLQREVYKHLKAALSSLHPDPRPQEAQEAPAAALAVPEAEGDLPDAGKGPENAGTAPSTPQQRSALAQYAKRAGADAPLQRGWLWATMLHLPAPTSTTKLSGAQADALLIELDGAEDDYLKACMMTAMNTWA